MYQFCICCKQELTEANSYRNSFSCKECQKISNKLRRKRRPTITKKLADEVRRTKVCCLCQQADNHDVFFLLNKSILEYKKRELDKLDAVHLTCLMKAQLPKKKAS